MKRSANNLPTSFTFPAGQTSVRVPFTINDDMVGLEDLETYSVSLGLRNTALNINLGSRTTAKVQIMDDDGVYSDVDHVVVTGTLLTLFSTVVSLNVVETAYAVSESDPPLVVSYFVTGQAIRSMSFDVINVDETATGGGVGELNM